MTVSMAAKAGMTLLNWYLSRRAPATILEREFMIPLTPWKKTNRLLYIANALDFITSNYWDKFIVATLGEAKSFPMCKNTTANCKKEEAG